MPDPGPLLREARLRAGLTQAEVAARLGTTQSAIARMERPDANPTVRWLQRALEATGARLEQSASLPHVDESQLRERLALAPVERLRAFSASQRAVEDVRRRMRRVPA